MALLKNGSKGPKVEDLQKMLNKVKAKPSLTPDGKFGSNTLKAVKHFQKQKKLVVDGLVGENTLAALKKASGGPGGTGGTGGTGGGGPAAKDPKLEKAFVALHKKLHKELKSNSHLMFITLQSLKLAPGSCQRIGTRHFTDLIPVLQKMLKSGAAIAKKNNGFLELLDQDAKLFQKELQSDPDKAKKRFLVVKNKEKQIDQLAREFQKATDGFRAMHQEIQAELRKLRTEKRASA